jgi:hypothetical protein
MFRAQASMGIRALIRWGRGTALVAVGLLLGLLAVEGAVRFWDWAHGIDHRLYLKELRNSDSMALGIWVPSKGPLEFIAERAYRRYPPLMPNAQVLATTSDYRVVYRINGRGLRDREYALEKASGVARVLAFGDSFTFGVGVTEAECFTEVAEGRLRGVEILNMGVPGYGLDQMLLSFLAQGVRYQPDLVVVFLSSHVANRHRTGIVDGDTVRVPERLEEVALDGDTGGTVYFGPDHPFWGRQHGWLVRHSHALALVTFRLQVRQLQKRFEEQDAKFWARQRSINKRTTVAEDPNVVRRRRSAVLLRELRRVVEATGARFLVVNIDDHVTAEYLASDAGLDVVDLAPELAARKTHAPLTFTYDQHYDAATHRLLGERLADVLTERLERRPASQASAR